MRVGCEHVSYRYRSGTTAVRDVTFELRPGVTGLVGINGAGKSTLLRMLSGGLRPSDGTVSVLGRSVYGAGRRDSLRHCALMPQEFNVPREIRAVDVVAYLGWLRGLRSKVAAERAEQVMSAVGLADRLHTGVHQLSGGMLRRLALAQALVSDPTLLLLDEPTTGLDPEQRAAVRGLLAGLGRDRVTVISSHVMEDIEALAERLIVLDAGEILFHGSVSDFVGEGGGAEHAFLAMISRRRTA